MVYKYAPSNQWHFQKRVLTALANGESLLTDENIPEEHLKQINQWEDEFNKEYGALASKVAEVYDNTKEMSNKDFAMCGEPSDIKSLVFAMRKGQRFEPIARNLVKRKLLSDTAD